MINNDCFNLKIENCLLKINESSAQIIFGNNKIFSITLPESNVLKRLIQDKGNVVSREELIIEAWGRADIIGPNSLPVAITNLRKVLGLSNIKIINIPKKGYKLVLPSDELRSQESNTQPTSFYPPSTTAKPSSSNNKTLQFQQIKLRIGLIVASSGLLLTLYASFYIGFSWVSLDCQQNDQVTLCRIQGDHAPPPILNGKQGLFYSANNTLLEVIQND